MRCVKTSLAPKHTSYLALGLLAGWALSCSSSDKKDPFIEVPDSFDATFVAGQVCMPSQIPTGTSEGSAVSTYPVRFDVCTHRCIAFDRTQLRIQTNWYCSGGLCDMMLLTMVHANRVQTEENCNALELVNPPPGECTPESFSFNLDPPCCLDNPDTGNSEYVSGDFRVTIPFFDIQQGQEVASRIMAGEDARQVVLDVTGPQSDPKRQFVVNFDPSHPAVPSADQLAGSDCHTIPPP
jgi:hypothetical protein